MTLMNWPPSRGPNPHAPTSVFLPGVVEREDVERVRPQESQQAEQDAIESTAEAVDAPAAVPTDVLGSLVAVPGGGQPIPIEKDKPLMGEFRCDYHVATVATLTLEQAHTLLSVRTVTGYAKRPREHKPMFIDRGLDPDYVMAPIYGRNSYLGEYEPKTLTTVINYPLSLDVKLTIPPFCVKFSWPDGRERERRNMSAGYMLWTIAKEYERIYAEHAKYGVWGHDIGDLHFEGFRIEEDGSTHLHIGS
jgi:hypothetical protein